MNTPYNTKINIDKKVSPLKARELKVKYLKELNQLLVNKEVSFHYRYLTLKYSAHYDCFNLAK